MCRLATVAGELCTSREGKPWLPNLAWRCPAPPPAWLQEEAASRTAEVNALAGELEVARQEAADRAREAEEAVSQLRAAQGAIDRSKGSGAAELAELRDSMRKVGRRCGSALPACVLRFAACWPTCCSS